MPLADLISVPTRPDDFSLFAFANQDQHRLINAAILKAHGTVLAEYALDPMPVRDMSEWLDLHQQMHINQNAILGIEGYNLMDLDPKDPHDMAAWMAQHFQEHALAAQILGIT